MVKVDGSLAVVFFDARRVTSDAQPNIERQPFAQIVVVAQDHGGLGAAEIRGRSDEALLGVLGKPQQETGESVAGVDNAGQARQAGGKAKEAVRVRGPEAVYLMARVLPAGPQRMFSPAGGKPVAPHVRIVGISRRGIRASHI